MSELASLLKSGENGLASWKRTVSLSTAVMVLTAAKSLARGDLTFGSLMRLMLNATSSAVKSRPLWNFTPERSSKVQVRPLFDDRQDLARLETMRLPASTLTKVS